MLCFSFTCFHIATWTFDANVVCYTIMIFKIKLIIFTEKSTNEIVHGQPKASDTFPFPLKRKPMRKLGKYFY